MDYNFAKIEKKWQKAWEKAKLGEAKVDKMQSERSSDAPRAKRASEKKKFFNIFAYVTVSGFLHTGHMRGYSFSDMVSRYKRMRGYNVLFPTGGHATGNGAIAKAQKIKEGNAQWIKELEDEGVPAKEIKKLGEPEKFVEFFNKTYQRDFKAFGFLMDNTRFISTISPDYGKFIEWQFKKLNQLKLLKKDSYFATYCPKDGPVAVDPSESDLLKGGKAEKQEFTLLKFKFGDNYLVAATLRPETVFGQTNLWVNPEIELVRAKVGNETWIISGQALKKLSFQKGGVEVLDSVDPKQVIGKKAIAPGVDRDIPILPSSFVVETVGTGIVTSVPSDAPYDYIALKDLQEHPNECKKYGLDYEFIKNIKIIPIIKTELGEFAAESACKKFGIKNQEDPKLEEATQIVYKAGFHTGIMNENCGKYSGMKVSEAKEKVKQDLLSKRKADIMYDLSEEVICRCGEHVVIKKIDDQWFIRYSDELITKKSIEHAKTMMVLPEDYKNNLPGALEWFADRACARQGRWLGTKLPFDKSYTIEAISDSTLYPIYFPVAKYVNDGKVKAEELTEEFFDYIYMSRGTAKKKIWETIKEEVEYWLPLDINLGGKEHQTVHFPPFIKSHVAILRPEFWPRGIITNAWVFGKGGTKLSKSKGNAMPVQGVAQKVGIDAMRLYYANVANLFADLEFDEEAIAKYKGKVGRIFEQLLETIKMKESKKSHMDGWMASVFNAKTKKITELMESYNFKPATDIIYSDLYSALQWYLRRGGKNKSAIKQIMELWLPMMAPFTPHIAEELWQALGKKGFVSTAGWPEADETKINAKAEQAEEQIAKTSNDIRNILKIINTAPKKICIYAIPNELESYKSAEEFYSQEFSAEVKAFAVNDKNKYDPEGKASKAKPGKPGIYLE